MSQHIDQLFEKYLNGTCSPEEWQELLVLISHIEENDADTLTGPMHILWEKARNKELPSTSLLLEREKMYKAVTDKENIEVAPVVHRVHFLKTSWFRYAAAVVLVAGGAAIWYKLSQSSHLSSRDNATSIASVGDVQPGSNKAVLTLADGSQIVLDNAANGNLAKQGNASVVKLSNGQLAYKVGSGLSREMVYNSMSTPRGGQYRLTLPDGSKVWLNAASSIRYPTVFTGSERKVEVTGEVYMEISKNAKQPFIVKANGTEVRVLGTSFNINAYEDEGAMRTTLIEGSVKVIATDNNHLATILKPGEQCTLVEGQWSVVEGQSEAALAWKNGYFQFDKASIPAVMRQLSRWYDLDIHYAGAVPDRLFKGKLQRSLPLSGILNVLEKTGLHVKLEGKSLIVLP